MIAGRLERVGGSVSVAQFERIRELQRSRPDVISLTAGEPHFGTPEFVIDAAERAMREQRTGYTPVAGLPELREAIAAKLRQDNDLEYDVQQIQVTAGAKQAIFNAMLATIDPGDEVIIPAPGWVSYAEIVRLCGGEPVFLEAAEESGFVPRPADLEALITPRTRWLILNSPSNPTGALYDAEALRALGEVLRLHPSVWVLSDDIYEHLVFDGADFATLAGVVPDFGERSLIVNGFSKAYCMTGWRLGYAAGPTELIDAMGVVQSHSTTHAPSVSQWAGLAALKGDRAFMAENVRLLERNRELLMQTLESVPGMHCVRPCGAFYAFPSCRGLIGATTPTGDLLEDDRDVAEYFLTKAGVACMMGAAFGRSPHLRLSFSLSHEALVEACKRIVTACADLKPATSPA